jgi:hypothetical protein
VKYKGRNALQLVPLADKENSDEGMLAILNGTNFKDGTIEVEVAGAPCRRCPRHGWLRRHRFSRAESWRGTGVLLPAAVEWTRGRPTQAQSFAPIPVGSRLQLETLRTENPGVYESYADLVPGEWTKVKVVVQGTKAKLYVNGADQPALVVNDLKHGGSPGAIALRPHTSTDGYFSNLMVK